MKSENESELLNHPIIFAMLDDISQAAQRLGRLGGISKSQSKVAAAKANGKLGGRPNKQKRVFGRG
jgi:hypothetical protein